jgi:ATP-dependent DNA helicase UvrD/PcrA
LSRPGQWQPPTVQDEDVAWASELMGLGPNGFAKVDEDESRLSAIKNLDTADFEACPGSGKTTLLVAKLAILANRWGHPRQGICVLSHTNAARNEIGTRLSASPVSVALLRYPHFVGTIHSFVNEFLALPWLRSKGNPVSVIDTQIALRHRMALLSWNWKSAMERRFLTEHALAYDAPNYTGGVKGALTTSSPLYQAMVAASKASSEVGYFCYDEMFVWANELLDVRPEVATALRERFPVVFVDEAQDNSELQAALLHRVFSEGASPSRRQRFGDSNQAIYNSFEQAGASTDPFPSSSKFDLPRSYRFNQVIADKVRGLGVIPQPLIGAGPSPSGIKAEPKAPIVFLFDDDSVGEVLPYYAAHLVDQFSRDELESGTFVAIAGVHDSSRVEPIPCSMKHYEPNYDAAYARRASSPATFVQYLARARYEMGGTGNVFPLVFATASAVLRLAAMAESTLNHIGPRSPHRRALNLLQNDGDSAKYSKLVEFVVSRKGDLSKSDWDGCCKQLAVSVAEAIAGSLPSSVPFLKWPELSIGAELETETIKRRTDNLFSYPQDAPIVHVRLGSIHSVKGETHTAALVLESFYYDHHLSELKPWLLGARSGGIKKGMTFEGSRLLGRLRLHYVAMTRPSHLLCIAMRKDALDDQEIVTLRERGWQIIDCCDGT